MHYYQHHIGDYAFATSHLSVEEDCAYRRILDLYYDTESPIPDDPAFVAKRIRMLSHVEIVKALLNEFFSLQEDGWHSSRADAEIASYKRMQDGGRNGANKRWSKAGDSHPIATLSPPQSPPQANPNSNQEPVTNNQESTTLSDSQANTDESVQLKNGKAKFSEDAKEVISFLNQKTGRNYRPVLVNLDIIASRLKEGATLQDCKSVIAKKTREWRGDEKMEPYLRPATLFNRTKFAQYVGELVND